VPIRKPVVLSASRAETSSRCHRRHVLGAVVDRKLFNDPYATTLDFGTVMHAGTCEWWRNDDAQSALGETRTVWKRLRPSGDRHSLEMAEMMMTGYIKTARLAVNMPGDWEIATIGGELMLERRMLLTLNGRVFSFQLDRLLVNQHNDYLIVDTKTSARIDTRWHRRWDLNLQQMLYRAGVAKIVPEDHRNLLGVIEGLEKKAPFKLVPHTLPQWDQAQLGEALAQWETRAMEDERLLTLGEDLAMEKHGHDYTQEQLREVVEGLAVTMTDVNYDDCFAYGRECEYRRLCVATPSMLVACRTIKMPMRVKTTAPATSETPVAISAFTKYGHKYSAVTPTFSASASTRVRISCATCPAVSCINIILPPRNSA